MNLCRLSIIIEKKETREESNELFLRIVHRNSLFSRKIVRRNFLQSNQYKYRKYEEIELLFFEYSNLELDLSGEILFSSN
jgi:hypothetical protein